MLFHTLTFAAFLAIVLALTAVTRNATARKAVLLIASYVFYGWSVPFYLVPLLITTAVDFVAALLLDREPRQPRRRLILAVSIVANLGLLAYFKYFGFFVTSAAAALRTIGFDVTPPLLEILLPVGISFYTFHSMSYTIDVYRREIPACRSPLDYGLFITFFPVLVAGPILRARQFLPQLREPVRIAVTTPALLLIVRGYAKKLLVADNLSPFADAVFHTPHLFPGVVIWIGTIAFAIQIYCDFSGYSDVARGVAALFGFTIPRNFDRPYAATNPSDFWRRWHISLSTWLRDYLYIPLGGSRGPRWKVARNLIVTMLLGGLWHGASWNFVLWGAFHGLLLVAHRLLVDEWRLWAFEGRLARAVARVAMFHLVCYGWLLFRASSFHQIRVFTGTLLHGLGGLGPLGAVPLVVALLAASLWAVESWVRNADDPGASLGWHRGLGPLACALLVMAIVLFTPTDTRSFIYFQF